MANIWLANTAYGQYTYAEPTTYNGYKYEATTGGTSHATTEPTWPTTIGNTVVDGTVTWTCRAHSDLLKPTLASKYLGMYDDIRDLCKDIARMFNPDTSVVNLPTGTIRRNPTTKKFEEWNSSAWVDLDLSGQDIGKVDGYDASATATQANKIPVRDSGGRLVKGDQQANTAYKDESNTFTTGQGIQGNLTAGENGRIILKQTTAGNSGIQIPSGSATFDIENNSAVAVARWDTVGTQILGTVPLARMGTVVASGTVNIASAGSQVIAIGTGGQHEFFQTSVYSSAGVVYESEVGGGGTTYGTFLIQRYAPSFTNYLNIKNEAGSTRDFHYKVYKLTET